VHQTDALMPRDTQQSRFSTGLRVTDLDDFLPSSTACVLPLQGGLPPPGSVAAPVYSHNAHDANGETNTSVARVTLSDCLSCSGCITSAETVLLATHSVDNFVTACSQSADAFGAVVVAPAVVASLASVWKLAEIESVLERIQTIFDKFGAFAVVLNSVGRCLSVLETCAQAVERLQPDQNDGSGAQQPLFASACPGWTFYVEKTQPHLVSCLATAKSPQAMMQLLVRHELGEHAWTVSIAPCYDKKLESQRDAKDSEHVFVLTATEVLELAERAPPHMPNDARRQLRISQQVSALTKFRGAWWATFGGLSGGYAVEVFRYVAQYVFKHRVSDAMLEPAAVRERNPDLRQLLLYQHRSSGDFVVSFRPVIADDDLQLRYSVATAYGFRNIQNIVRQYKHTGRCNWNFVEVMACPGGCGNGNGLWVVQDTPTSTPVSAESVAPVANRIFAQRTRQERIQEMERSLQRLPCYHVDELPQLRAVWATLREAEPQSLRFEFCGFNDRQQQEATYRQQDGDIKSQVTVSERHRLVHQW